jgi:dTMP kinase
MTGKFIVFEGIDGSGKGTCLKHIANYLKSKKVNFIVTEEPNLKYGIRNLIKKEILQKQVARDPLVDLFAFSLDRQLHVENEIKPALFSNRHVLCDRYYHSTIAYQGYVQGIPLNYVLNVQSIFPKPDLTLIFDLPADLAMQRAAKRGTKKDKYETLEFQKNLREAYLKLPEILQENIVIIDATKSEEEVKQQAIKAIKPILNL